MIMKLINVTTAILALATAINACCLPKKFSIDFVAKVQEQYRHTKTGVQFLSGSLGADFGSQRFRVLYTNAQKETQIIWFFDFQKGEYMYSHQHTGSSQQDWCRIHPLKGLLDKHYKCMLGNKHFVAQPVHKHYKLLLANVAKLTGPIHQESCELYGKQVLAIILEPNKYVQAQIEILNMKSHHVKLAAPCSGKMTKYNPLSFPNVDELARMRSETFAAAFDLIRKIETPPIEAIEESAEEEEEESEEGESGDGADTSGDGAIDSDDEDDYRFEYRDDYRDDNRDDYRDDNRDEYRDEYDEYDASADGETDPIDLYVVKADTPSHILHG